MRLWDNQLFFTTGGACNGVGELVNSSIDNQLYCRCNDWYTGKSDMFDTSFAHPPGDDTLSLTCSNSRIAEIVIWSFIFLPLAVRIYQVLNMFLEKYAYFKQQHESRLPGRPFTWAAMYDFFVLRILLFDLCVVMPFVLTTAALKVAGQTIGTDIPVTVLYSVSVVLFQIGTVVFAQREFRLLTAFLPESKREHLRLAHTRASTFAIVFYIVSVATPTLAALGLDKRWGPWENGEYLCLVMRSSMCFLWCMLSLAANHMVYKEFSNAITSLVDERSTAALLKMKQINVDMVKFYLTVATGMAVFCIPHLWAFQTYMLAVIVLSGTMRHPAKAFQAQSSDKNNSPSRESKDLLASGQLASGPAMHILSMNSDFGASPPVTSAGGDGASSNNAAAVVVSVGGAAQQQEEA